MVNGINDRIDISWKGPDVQNGIFSYQSICNGNRTEWSPIRSVIIRVIYKIGRHEVLLPINHNFNKICDIIGYFLNQNTRNSKFCFARGEKKKAI